MYCYSTSPALYTSFSIVSASSALKSLCSAGYTLQPNQRTALTATYGSNPVATAAVGWAPNQSGCNPETAVPITGGEITYCQTELKQIVGSCESDFMITKGKLRLIVLLEQVGQVTSTKVVSWRTATTAAFCLRLRPSLWLRKGERVDI